MNSSTVRRITDELNEIVSTFDPTTDTAISGMALGIDQLYCRICFDHNIPVVAYIPFVGQESRWPVSSRRAYRALLGKCESVVTVCNRPSIAAMFERNANMVRDSDSAIAVWDGSSGGTGNAVSLIRRAGLPLTVIPV
jgi:uncharacterized phage-like protein YoqJ